MASLSSRQSPSQPTSGRSTIAQLGRAQQPQPPLLSGRVAVGQMGVGRRYAGHSNLLTPRQLQLPVPPLPDFARLRADAERIKLQVAAQGGSTAPAHAPAASHGITPKQAGYPIPFISPADQARWAREKRLQEKALAEYNQVTKSPYLPAFLRDAMSKPKVKLQAVPAGPDSFMPNSFWQSQNPDGKGSWTACAATVYAMLAAHYPKGSADAHPAGRYDLVVEHTNATWSHGYRTRDYYMAAPNSSRATQGMAKLDEYMAAHRPVMVGVSHTINFFLTSKNKQGEITKWREINGGTIDHFIALVGTGVDKKGKYYRFFDVGTQWPAKGTSPKNKLYYNAATGFYEGHSEATGDKYVLAQVRF